MNSPPDRLDLGMPLRTRAAVAPEPVTENPPRRRLRRLFAALGALAALWLLVVVPPPLWYRFHDPGRTAFMRLRQSQARERGDTAFRIHHHAVPLAQVAPVMQRAVLVAEDHRFPMHNGIDWIEVRRALGYPRDEFHMTRAGDWGELMEMMWASLTGQRRARGASTITQQLAKNLYLSPQRSLPRKVKEALLAKRLEWTLSKERILELYLNNVEFGVGIFGVEAASQHYFGKPARQLTRQEAASLAATLPAPLRSNPHSRPAEMLARRAGILARLR